MTFHVVTLFEESFDSYISSSVLGRALSGTLPKKKKGEKAKKADIKIKFYNPRDFVSDKNRRIDQRPYGGGPGMVIEAMPVVKAVEKIIKRITPPPTPSPKGRGQRGRGNVLIIFTCPSGKQFDTTLAKKSAQKYSDIIIVCGRYEGIDERAKKIIRNLAKSYKLKAKNLDLVELSVGPYVLTGGELPAMIMIDSIARQIEGVLGNFDSREEERVSSSEVYTRPEVIEYPKNGGSKKYRVPKVLLSGDHKKIEEWKVRRKII